MWIKTDTKISSYILKKVSLECIIIVQECLMWMDIQYVWMSQDDQIISHNSIIGRSVIWIWMVRLILRPMIILVISKSSMEDDEVLINDPRMYQQIMISVIVVGNQDNNPKLYSHYDLICCLDRS